MKFEISLIISVKDFKTSIIINVKMHLLQTEFSHSREGLRWKENSNVMQTFVSSILVGASA